ncbi:MFS transporter [Streptomyces sp. NPDC060002]|uniref:MFS transporter n=1 Tax=Streptomyces sp. NPDC060002 TaxID=3347033 RepID=UPI00368BFAFF
MDGWSGLVVRMLRRWTTEGPVLPVQVWAVLGADALSAVGSGLTLPFLLVYLHTVRGLSLGTAGAVCTTLALAGLVGNPLGGVWADRFGPRPVLALGWATASMGAVMLATVSNVWQAFAGAAVAGLGAALAWPALDTFLAAVVPERRRSSVFALRHATMNAGLAAGSLLASVIAQVGRPSSFVLLYTLDAASFLLAIPLLWAARNRPAGSAPVAVDGEDAAAAPADGYRVVARDGLFVRLWLLIAVLVTVGIAQFNTAFPLLAVSAQMSAAVVGWAFAANMVTVTACQLLVLRAARGRRRTSAIVVLCALWACSWMLVLAGRHLGMGVGAMLFVSAAVVFGFGETLFAPALPALVNDIAPQALRGRYNGASAFAYTTGFALGPAAAGLLLQHGLDTVLLLGLTLACTAAAALAVTLRRRLPPGVDIIDPPAPDGATEPATPAATHQQEAPA